MSDIIYIPDPPGLMKTGGLHPTPVTLPLVLTAKIGWIAVWGAAVSSVFLGFATFAMFSALTMQMPRPSASDALFLWVWSLIAVAIVGPPAIVSVRSIANRLLHRGPALRLDGDGFEFRRFNQTVFAAGWAEVDLARFGVAQINPFATHSSDAVLITLSHDVPGRRYALKLSPTWGRPLHPWPRRLPNNVVALPIDDLSMPRSTVRLVIEELVRRNGRPMN